MGKEDLNSATVALAELIQTRLLASRNADLSDQEVLLQILKPIVERFEELSDEARSQAFALLLASVLAWVHDISRHPEILNTPRLRVEYVI